MTNRRVLLILLCFSSSLYQSPAAPRLCLVLLMLQIQVWLHYTATVADLVQLKCLQKSKDVWLASVVPARTLRRSRSQRISSIIGISGVRLRLQLTPLLSGLLRVWVSGSVSNSCSAIDGGSSVQLARLSYAGWQLAGQPGLSSPFIHLFHPAAATRSLPTTKSTPGLSVAGKRVRKLSRAFRPKPLAAGKYQLCREDEEWLTGATSNHQAAQPPPLPGKSHLLLPSSSGSLQCYCSSRMTRRDPME